GAGWFLGWRIRGDADRDIHAEEVGGKPGPGAGQRHRVPRVAHYRDADQIAVADDAVGRIELEPAGAGDIDLQPGMGGAAADMPATPMIGDVEISRDESGGETKRADRF